MGMPRVNKLVTVNLPVLEFEQIWAKNHPIYLYLTYPFSAKTKLKHASTDVGHFVVKCTSWNYHLRTLVLRFLQFEITEILDNIDN